MSALGEAIGAVREALKLADDVKRAGETLKEMAVELREHDRRLTRIEAQLELLTGAAMVKRLKGGE
ncbi:MAG TPA: hypothetical protein VLU41_10015 [Ideonella sp.]|nr:hypothetical protein [Ideonella sp.]